MTTHYDACIETTEDELYRWLVWWVEEMGYVTGKFGGVCSGSWDDRPEGEFIEEWTRQVVQYVDRAKVFGLDTLPGRQALAKAAATMVAFATSAVRLHGDLPRGGTPSGEVVPR